MPRIRAFKDRIKLLPHILYKAYKYGWKAGELEDYWKYEYHISGDFRGTNIHSINA